MPSAVDFLPCHIIELMNFVTRSDPYTGSASTVRFGVCPFRGISASSSWLLASRSSRRRGTPRLYLTFLLALRSVLRASLLAVRYAGGVERSADHVITHARQIFHTAPADQHNRVLLQVVADARNVSRHFNPIGQPYARDFPQRRVRLLGSLGVHARTNSALLRTRLQRRTRRLVARPFAALHHELIKCRHSRHSQTRQARLYQVFRTTTNFS